MKNFRIKYLFILISVLFLFQACQTTKNDWILKGNTSESNQLVYLYRLNRLMEKTLIDSVQVLNGKFTIQFTNSDDQLAAYVLAFSKNEKNGVEFPIKNGDHLKVTVKKDFNSEFSGTAIAKDFNEYNKFRSTELRELTELQKILSKDDVAEEDLNDKMIVFKEKMQELENEKIKFLRSIQNPELNSFLILNEIISNGIIEKELFIKYINALTPEGAMTNNGHRIHQIYDVMNAFALSRELEILDTATLHERYNNLDEINMNSEFAQKIKDFLDKND